MCLTPDVAQVANHTIAILLGLIYCIIQPVIAPVVMFYCLIALGVAKYQAIYVLRPAYESGGAVRGVARVSFDPSPWGLAVWHISGFHRSHSTAMFSMNPTNLHNGGLWDSHPMLMSMLV